MRYRSYLYGILFSLLISIAIPLPSWADEPCIRSLCFVGAADGNQTNVTAWLHEWLHSPSQDPTPENQSTLSGGGNYEKLPPQAASPAPRPKVSVLRSDMRGTQYCKWQDSSGRVITPCSDEIFSGEDGEEEPSPADVLYTALDTVTIEGAGLVVQPTEWVYTNIPTLAHAQTDTIHTSAHVFGLEVPITLTATSFEFDFHDGNQPVRSPVPGLPYPSMEIYGVYTQETDAQTVTLRTSWRAVATHPITGDSIQINGAVVTVEESAPFKVKKRRIRLSLDKDFARH